MRARQNVLGIVESYSIRLSGGCVADVGVGPR